MIWIASTHVVADRLERAVAVARRPALLEVLRPRRRSRPASNWFAYAATTA